MGHPQIAAFARSAEGNAKPIRVIAGQNTLFNRTIHDMAYDPVRDEIVVPSFFASAILTFRGDTNGNVPPVRKIFGPDTQLRNTETVAIDPVHAEIFVPQNSSVLVFPMEADGNVAPIRVLKGPDTKLGAKNATVDPVHNLLIVDGRKDGRGQILIFNRTDQGNTKPRAVITGPKSLIEHASPSLLTTYPSRELFALTVLHEEQSSPKCFVGVWSIHDNGDAPPRWTIGGPDGILRRPHGIALDPETKNIMVSDKYLNAVITWHFPEMF